MCNLNPNCKLKETVVYKSPKTEIVMCKCGYSCVQEKEDILKSEMVKIENAIEKYNKN